MGLYYVTVAGAGTKAGNDWANAMDLAAWETHAEGSSAAGDDYVLDEGTYTLTNGFSTAARPGTSSSLIRIIGSTGQTTPYTPAVEGSCPLIACAANTWALGQYWAVTGIEFTTTEASGIQIAYRVYLDYVKATNSSGTANRYAVKMSTGGNRYIRCELESTNGRALGLLGGDVDVLRCNLKDSAYGIFCWNAKNRLFVAGCFFDGCVLGASLNGWSYNTFISNTFYGTGASYAIQNLGAANILLNNIVKNWNVGFYASANRESSYFDYNNYHGNNTDVTNVTKGTHATAHDPQFTDAPNGDFRIAGDCLTAGMPITLGTGGNTITTHQGAVPPVAGAGGGCVRSPIGMTGGMAG